jgi:coenzyme F420-reducing hydrogenase beta subunit
MTDIISDMKLCTGCAACVQACSQDALTMKENHEGFLYPEISELKCTDCGLCRKICPVNAVLNQEIPQNAKNISENIKVYACYSRDDNIREKSSSGGVFSLLAESVLSQNGVVFGAEFDGNFRVRHGFTEKMDGIDALRRSKYVQSDMGDIYGKAKSFLKDGRKVLFCGTPCQVAGLKAFLAREYQNLLTCDFVCTGVPSPRIWDMYLDYMIDKYNSGIAEISFRDKSAGWRDYNMQIIFKNGSKYIHKAKTETFFIGFGKNIFNRSSCFHCMFRIQNTKADITLADFWGIDKLDDKVFTDNKGVSLTVVHTQAGKAVLSTIMEKMCIREQSFDVALAGNPRLASSFTEPKIREKFFNDLKSGFTFDRLRKKYMDNFSVKYKVKRLIKLILHRI